MKIRHVLVVSLAVLSWAGGYCSTYAQGVGADAPEVGASERSSRLIRVNLEDCQGNLRSIGEKLRSNDYPDVADHANEIYKLAQESRRAAIDMPGARGELLMRDMSDLQHAADNLRDAAAKKRHKECHDSSEAIGDALKKIEKDLAA